MFELKKNEVNYVTIKWYVENLKNVIKIGEKEIQYLNTFDNQELEQVITDIICNISIGGIAITEDNYLMDGYKHITAINSFIDGKIKYNGKYYVELNDEEKERFYNYQLSVFQG